MSAAPGAPPQPPAAAAAAVLEPFDSWASRHRRRAARDGAWRVEVSERVQLCAVIRSVTTWHDLQQQHKPQRQVKPKHTKPGKQQQQQQQKPCSAAEQQPQQPQQPNAKKRRSALRSAAHHRQQQRIATMRRAVLVVRFVVRLRRQYMATLAMRNVGMPKANASSLVVSPSKRRLSPPPDALPTGSAVSFDDWNDVSDAASPPPPKRHGPFQKGFLLGR